MPHIGPNGRIAHGVGGSWANLDNKPFSIGSLGNFMDDDRIAFNSGEIIVGRDDWSAAVYRISTGKIESLPNPPYTDPPFQSQFMYAGGGHACWWSGMRGGLFSTTGFNVLGAGLLGMGRSGAICYKPNYQSWGPTNIHELNGDDWQLTDGVPDEGSVNFPGDEPSPRSRVVYTEGGWLKVANMPAPTCLAADGGMWKPCAAFAGGRWWISYYSATHGITIHPFDSFEGYSIVPPGVDGWHTIRELGPDIIRFACSVGIAEQAGQIFARDINVRTGEIIDVYTAQSLGIIPTVDVRTVKIPEPPIVIEPVNRALWFGFFVGGPNPGGGWTTNDDPKSLPGNCYIAVQEASLRDKAGNKFGAWVSVEGEPNPALRTVEEIERRARVVDFPIAYWDDNHWPRFPVLPKPSLLCVRAYAPTTISLTDLERSVSTELRTVPPGQPVALIAQCYTSNTRLTDKLSQLVPIYARLARDNPNVAALFVFSGNGRATGLQDHPEVRPFWEQVEATITTPPKPVPAKPVPPVDPPKPPSFFKQAAQLKGSRMRFYGKKNGKFVGVEPNTDKVYTDRTSPGAWEAMEITKSGDDYFAEFVEAKKTLSMTPDGLQTRPAGTRGGWESLRGVEMPGGEKWLYRVEGGKVVDLLILQAA